MSKFLTPPVWYDKNGSEINIFNNTTYPGAVSNTAIGTSAIAGRPSSEGASFGAVAVGSQAKAKGPLSIAIGSYDDDSLRMVQALGSGSIVIGGGAMANENAVGGIAIGKGATAINNDTIAIGSDAKAWASGCIAIGAAATADTTPNTIQLGDNTTAYTLKIGDGRMSLNIGSTAQSNWISATSDGISQGLYLVRYSGGSYMDLVYLMAPIAITDISGGSTYTNDWYFPFYTNPLRLTINNPSDPNNPSHPIVCSCYYLKVDKTSSASNLKITPGYYKNDGNNSTPVFQSMSDGSSVYLFKIL